MSQEQVYLSVLATHSLCCEKPVDRVASAELSDLFHGAAAGTFCQLCSLQLEVHKAHSRGCHSVPCELRDLLLYSIWGSRAPMVPIGPSS